MMVGFMVVAGCLALGLVRVLHLVAPPRIDLAAGVGRWDQDRDRASRHRDDKQTNGSPRARATAGAAGSGRTVGWSPLDRVVVRLAEQVTRRGRDLTGLSEDLAITGSNLERHLSKVLGLVVVAVLGPPVILGMLHVVGLAVPVGFGLALGVGLAVGMVVLAQRELHTTAGGLRAEFRRSLSIYLDLVAMCLEAGRGHGEALPAAANIGTGWTFLALQDAIDGARFSGVTAWESLGALGHRIGMPQLADLDAALRLANDDGAKIKATLVARAGTLRSARIADAEADAAEATESMKFTLIVMVFAFLAYELYPSIVRLFAG